MFQNSSLSEVKITSTACPGVTVTSEARIAGEGVCASVILYEDIYKNKNKRWLNFIFDMIWHQVKNLNHRLIFLVILFVFT